MEMNVVVGVKTEVSFSSARRKLSCDAMDKGSPGDHLARNEGELKNGKHSEREPQLIKVSEVLKSLVECHIEKEEQLSIIRVDERILGLKEAEKIVPKFRCCCSNTTQQIGKNPNQTRKVLPDLLCCVIVATSKLANLSKPTIDLIGGFYINTQNAIS
ncbi:hypothetical protein JHK84_055575 [Glycine max]|nr:hypothetical protein JHK86_055535 [Glycine max]KAG5074344.1 hypothetical protein JHK84_055575 [Glycine max]